MSLTCFRSCDDKGNPNKITVKKAGHGFSKLEAIRHDGTSYVRALADNATTMADYVVVEIIDADTFCIQNRGRAIVNNHGLTPGQTYYLSDTTLGLISDTAGGIEQAVLKAIDGNIVEIHFDKSGFGVGQIALNEAWITEHEPELDANTAAIAAMAQPSTTSFVSSSSGSLDSGKGVELDVDGLLSETFFPNIKYAKFRSNLGQVIADNVQVDTQFNIDSVTSPIVTKAINNSTFTINEIGFYLVIYYNRVVGVSAGVIFDEYGIAINSTTRQRASSNTGLASGSHSSEFNLPVIWSGRLNALDTLDFWVNQNNSANASKSIDTDSDKVTVTIIKIGN